MSGNKSRRAASRTIVAVVLVAIIVIAAVGVYTYQFYLKPKSIPVINVGVVVVPETVVSLMAIPYFQQHILNGYGRDYTIEITEFTGTPAEVDGLASGSLNIASLTYSSFLS